MAGKFVTFEGVEGAGKSTHVLRLAKHLRATGFEVTVTREPGGTPIAESIREFILSGAAKGLGPETETVLFAAARADHVDTVIRPALIAGGWVLCDRFIDSTWVYQGTADGVEPALIRALERVSVGKTRPDLTFILDLPAEMGLRRVADRQEGEPDRFEEEDVARHELRRTAFRDIANREPDRCVLIDATRPVDEIADTIARLVDSRLLQRAA